MKKLFMCIILMVFVLTSCRQPVKTDEVLRNNNLHNEREQLLLWSYYETSAQQGNLDYIIQGFNNSQDKYFVSWEYVSMIEFFKKLSIGFTQNDLPDLAIIDNPDMLPGIRQGFFEDITLHVKEWHSSEMFFKPCFDSTVHNDRIYGIPFTSNSVALIYNKDMFETAGVKVPKTWDEFRSVAQILSRDGIWGFGMSAIKVEQAAFQFLPWLYSTGTKLDSLNVNDAKKAFGLIADLINDGSLSQECINWTQVDVGRLFIEEKIAMMENGPWVLPAIKEAGHINWEIAKLPIDKQHAAVLGGENIGVIRGKNVEAAVEFLKYCSEPIIVESTAKRSGSVPPRKDIALSPRWASDPEYSVFVEQMDYAVLRGDYNKWPFISQIISEELRAVITGRMSPGEAAENLNIKILQLLE